MTENQWKQYYSQMVQRGSMKPEKEAEMVANCGGQKRNLVLDPADPQKQVERIETFDEAVKRIRGEILEMASRGSLERKADQILAELRRR